MKRLFVLVGAAVCLALGTASLGQSADTPEPAANPTQAARELADALTRQVGESLGVKAVVGKAVTAGSVTLIPILMVDVTFGGAGLVPPGGPPSAPTAAAPRAPLAGVEGFLMSGQARPLGFVVVTRQGTRFISVTQPAATGQVSATPQAPATPQTSAK